MIGCGKKKPASENTDLLFDVNAFKEQILVPPPPNASNDYAWKWKADQEAYRVGLKLRHTPRGAQAARDGAKPTPDLILATASEWLGTNISQNGTPKIAKYLLMGLHIISKSNRAAKTFYSRPRPFVLYPQDETCLKNSKVHVKPTTSYPSGHSCIYFGLALLVSSIHPECTANVMRKAWEKGESRWICGYHWASDVQAGREVAAAAYARMSADKGFLKMQNEAYLELKEKMQGSNNKNMVKK